MNLDGFTNSFGLLWKGPSIELDLDFKQNQNIFITYGFDYTVVSFTNHFLSAYI